MNLSEEHKKAVNRRRRVILNYDAMCGQMPYLEGDELTESMFGSADLPDSPIDSIWWNWGDGNIAIWNSKILQRYTHARMPEWEKAGFDPVGRCHAGAKGRGLESFFSYRINGSDADKWEDGHHIVEQVTFKKAHPEMCIYGTWSKHGGGAPMYDFAWAEVRAHKIAILEEVFELYDYDGVEIDYARACPVLPIGKGWENRGHMTSFMRELRKMLAKQARKRKHPILIAARVPETIAGCHFDGLDVETWVREKLVDILILGCRSFEVEFRSFRDLVRNAHVKLYPCLDDIHASDGYRNPPIEVFRGVITNWQQQGFEGMQTFNFQNSDPHVPTITRDIDQWLMSQWTLHKRVYEEIGSGDIFTGKKTFVVQRRLGGHAAFIQSYPWDWKTPRICYSNSNMEAQLPTPLLCDEDQDVFLHMYVGKLPRISARLVVKLSEAEDVKVRINGQLLGSSKTKKTILAWVDSDVLALGNNLITIALATSDRDCETWIEKVELHEYREPEYWETMYDD